jgi:tetratricopeptide (TPR) repeat protein
MTFYRFAITILFFFFTFFIYSQEQRLPSLDSLLQKEFRYLEDQFYNPSNSNKKALLYANAYLQKAKAVNDIQKQIDGFYYVALVVANDQKIILMDSLITLTKKTKTQYRMEDALVMKASVYYQKRLYKKALDFYIKAYDIAQKYDNTIMISSIEHNIGIVYNLIDEPQKGLDILKKSLQKFTMTTPTDRWRKLNVISSLVTSYRKLAQYDSANYFTD